MIKLIKTVNPFVSIFIESAVRNSDVQTDVFCKLEEPSDLQCKCKCVNLSIAVWRVSWSGVIKHGGVKPNIIPDYSELEYYLRTPSHQDLPNIRAKAEACFKAAAMATGCEVSA